MDGQKWPARTKKRSFSLATRLSDAYLGSRLKCVEDENGIIHPTLSQRLRDEREKGQNGGTRSPTRTTWKHQIPLSQFVGRLIGKREPNVLGELTRELCRVGRWRVIRIYSWMNAIIHSDIYHSSTWLEAGKHSWTLPFTKETLLNYVCMYVCRADGVQIHVGNTTQCCWGGDL